MSTARRIASMITRAVVSLVDGTKKMQVLQVKTRGGLAPDGESGVIIGEPDVRDGVEDWDRYGYTSCPFPDAEVLLLEIGGSGDHPAAVSVSDRRYRPTNLAEGEVCMYDDQAQKVWIKRTGVYLNGTLVDITGPTLVHGTLGVSGALGALSVNTGVLSFTSMGGGGISGGGGNIDVSVGYKCGGVAGATADFPLAGGSTLHIKGGLVTGVS